MPSVAILIANAQYAKLPPLDCCRDDLAAVRMLVEATGRYSAIRELTDADADAMKNTIRSALDSNSSFDEVFFYFSGHGAQLNSDFFFCGTAFDSARPYETGLSHEELQNLMRAAKPELLVRIVDACNSGTLLVKSDEPFLPPSKDGFRHIIQISSSLDAQNSFGGDPLSEFTRRFCEACISKVEGPIYYSDVMNALRDKFLDNPLQTPHFVSQGTGRELLVDDAAKLASFRKAYEERWKSGNSDEDAPNSNPPNNPIITPEITGTAQLLAAAEKRMATPEQASFFIKKLFDGVLTHFHGGKFGEFFITDIVEHSSFEEETAREFIIRTLSKENRSDNFVTARIRRIPKKRTPFDMAIGSWMQSAEYEERWDLELNCPLDRAQLKITFTPIYRSLQRLVLVLTCAPSLERCYVFEIVTQHPRTGWDDFDEEGREIVRRWYKANWDDDLNGVIERIKSALDEAVEKHVELITESLAKT